MSIGVNIQVFLVTEWVVVQISVSVVIYIIILSNVLLPVLIGYSAMRNIRSVLDRGLPCN